jgi:hypothetical protein
MIGRNLLTTSTVQPVRVSADGSPLYKAGGVTIDWTTVVAVAGADVTLPDGDVIRIGQKYLRYGQVLNSGVGAASLAAGPTLANVEAMFPTARWVRN